MLYAVCKIIVSSKSIYGHVCWEEILIPQVDSIWANSYIPNSNIIYPCVVFFFICVVPINLYSMKLPFSPLMQESSQPPASTPSPFPAAGLPSLLQESSQPPASTPSPFPILKERDQSACKYPFSLPCCRRATSLPARIPSPFPTAGERPVCLQVPLLPSLLQESDQSACKYPFSLPCCRRATLLQESDQSACKYPFSLPCCRRATSLPASTCTPSPFPSAGERPVCLQVPLLPSLLQESSKPPGSTPSPSLLQESPFSLPWCRKTPSPFPAAGEPSVRLQVPPPNSLLQKPAGELKVCLQVAPLPSMLPEIYQSNLRSFVLKLTSHISFLCHQS